MLKLLAFVLVNSRRGQKKHSKVKKKIVNISPVCTLVNAFLKKHKMEPIHVPWRHRFFWDGGLHCITLDLNREGVQQDYFGD